MLFCLTQNHRLRQRDAVLQLNYDKVLFKFRNPNEIHIGLAPQENWQAEVDNKVVLSSMKKKLDEAKV